MFKEGRRIARYGPKGLVWSGFSNAKFKRQPKSYTAV